MGVVLAILSATLFYVFSPILILYTLMMRTTFKRFDKHFYKVAISIDQLGNVIGEDMFNDIMIQPNGYKFGYEDETISSVLGRNYQKGTLRFCGRGLRWLLDHIEKDHCIKSIGA